MKIIGGPDGARIWSVGAVVFVGAVCVAFFGRRPRFYRPAVIDCLNSMRGRVNFLALRSRYGIRAVSCGEYTIVVEFVYL